MKIPILKEGVETLSELTVMLALYGLLVSVFAILICWISFPFWYSILATVVLSWPLVLVTIGLIVKPKVR
tara:strand:+ start:268 stop:477 length:210 start_codon:yes stop_codon:yes gene_type:complete